MKFTIIDYSDLYYIKFAPPRKPKRIDGKFVQMRHEGMEYLVFSPKEFSKYHADIVKTYCQGKGIDGVYDAQAKRFDIDDPAWVIIGGGKFVMNREEKVIRLYDNSMAYGRFEARGLKEKVLSVKRMSGYRVEIE
ncbi:MAG: hypothetical protein RDU01_01720 [Thermodesulfovibrionales bacterium]|nr:hypothetical protein [Thermodesulfovibrionales bacterium]